MPRHLYVCCHVCRRLLPLVAAIVLSLLPASLLASSGRFFQHGLMSSSLANKVCQDAYGYIWVGTEYGLNKFDGYRFTPYLHRDGDSTSLPSNIVTAFAVGKDKSLYIGSNKGLARYDYATNTFVTYHFPGGIQPRVRLLAEASIVAPLSCLANCPMRRPRSSTAPRTLPASVGAE